MKSYKIKINSPEESRQVQEHAFTLGYSWAVSHYKNTSYTYKSCLYFNANNRYITYSDLDLFDECDRFEEISVEDFLKLPIVTKSISEDGKKIYILEFSDSIVDPQEKLEIAKKYRDTIDTPKVYCISCKHFIYTDSFGGIERVYKCNHPSNKIIESTWLREQEQLKNPPSELNKNNDCKNYEEKIR